MAYKCTIPRDSASDAHPKLYVPDRPLARCQTRASEGSEGYPRGCGPVHLGAGHDQQVALWAGRAGVIPAPSQMCRPESPRATGPQAVLYSYVCSAGC